MGNIIALPVFPSGVMEKPGPKETDWDFKELKACAKETQESIPNKKSLRSKFGKVYCQIYGNCTSNAVLACDAYYYHDPNGKWEPSTVFTYYNQHKMNLDDVKKDNGSYVSVALDAVRKYGACDSKVWPNDKPFYKKPSKAAYANGLKGHEITKYYRIKSLLQIKKAIAKDYPVAIAMDWAFSYIDGSTNIFCSPTEDDIICCKSGHAIVIVGYDDETELFEIRNSWGDRWGDHGYAYIRYSDMKRLIRYDDSYAVVK